MKARMDDMKTAMTHEKDLTATVKVALTVRQ